MTSSTVNAHGAKSVKCNRFPITFQSKVHFLANLLAWVSEQVVFTASVREYSRERCEHSRQCEIALILGGECRPLALHSSWISGTWGCQPSWTNPWGPLPCRFLLPLPFAIPSLLSLRSRPGPLNPARESGACCMLLQLGVEPQPKSIWCILALKSDIWWQQI